MPGQKVFSEADLLAILTTIDVKDFSTEDESSSDSSVSSDEPADGQLAPRLFQPHHSFQFTVSGNVSGCQMSGWLEVRGKRGWKRNWFVLKDQVLYYYKASRDVLAYKTLPVLGYEVDQPTESIDEMDKRKFFRLTHDNQVPLIFLAPSEQRAELWISALNQATILK